MVALALAPYLGIVAYSASSIRVGRKLKMGVDQKMSKGNANKKKLEKHFRAYLCFPKTHAVTWKVVISLLCHVMPCFAFVFKQLIVSCEFLVIALSQI